MRLKCSGTSRLHPSFSPLPVAVTLTTHPSGVAGGHRAPTLHTPTPTAAATAAAAGPAAQARVKKAHRVLQEGALPKKCSPSQRVKSETTEEHIQIGSPAVS